MTIRWFAIAEWHKNLPHFAVHFDKARPVTFSSVEDDQIAKEIALSHLER